MATSTFDRKIEIKDEESIKKLLKVVMSNAPKEPISKHPFSSEDRKRGADLLKRRLLHSKI